MPENILSITMPRSAPAPKGRVLCVDDEPSILSALTWLLGKEFQVVTATSTQIGLELIRDDDFDVVISEQLMPEMDGVEFLTQVKTLAPFTVGILLTGASEAHGDQSSNNKLASFQLIHKPWKVAELPGIVAHAAENSRKQKFSGNKPTVSCETKLAGKTKLLVLDDDQAIHALVEISAGDLAEVIHVTDPIDAFRILGTEDVGVVLSDRTLGNTDLTNQLCLLKRQHPRIVSVVLTETEDNQLISKMIDQGKIFRIIHKSAKVGVLRETLKAAIARRHELQDNRFLCDCQQSTAAAAVDIETLIHLDNLARNDGECASICQDEPIDHGSLIGKFSHFLRRACGH